MHPDDIGHLRPEVPLIWRAPDKVHFGDHRVPVDLDPKEAHWLESLKSHRSVDAARAACPSGPKRADRILAAAKAAGALDEPGECWWLTPEERFAVRGELLALTQWQEDPGQALAARSACAVAVPGTGPVHDIVRAAFADCGLRTLAPEYADVVVLVGRGHIEAIEAHEEYAEVMHLPVRIHHARAAIGPLVLPGRTPCCRCLALHARDRDAAWPAMAAQWRSWSAPVPPDRLLAQRTALEAVTVLREWIDTASSGASGNSGPMEPAARAACRIHLELPGLQPHRERVRAHDACGCLWQNRTEVPRLSA